MIKYIGSKRVLIPSILRVIRAFSDVRTVLDLFSGTARVGHALKGAGYRVLANDSTAYAHALATCYVQADSQTVGRDAAKIIKELNCLPGRPGYFTETFCRRSRFFHPKNGERIDSIREWIASREIDAELEAVLLVSLMEAADRVDSTTGLQMAYLKDWAPRAHNDLKLRLPNLLPRARWGKGEAHRMDALQAAEELEADLAYIDPPYNQHSYLSNYHIWESLILWDKPQVYGIACKRVDCRTRKSVFNSRARAADALARVIERCKAKVLVVSFNDEGYIAPEQLEDMLGRKGRVVSITLGYKRYVGAQIGIYNPDGVKVGRVSHLRNREHIYIVADDAHADELAALEQPAAIQAGLF